MTYSLTSCKFQVLRKLTRCTSWVREISLQENTERVYKDKRRGDWIAPGLTALRIPEIRSVTGIVTGLKNISWIKMSVPELDVLDWNVEALPQDFGKQIKESSILAYAYNIRNSLPDSDLYVMESFTAREAKNYFGINQIHLSSMLTVLLNNFSKGSNWKENVFFQKKFVMNYLYNIVIGSERISTKPLVENILFKSTYLADCDSLGNSYKKCPGIKVDSKYIEKFKQSELEKQETLSLALLLNLSFIEVNLLKNENSVAKIQKRRKYKRS